MPKAPSTGFGRRLSLSLGRKLSLSAMSSVSQIGFPSNPRNDLRAGVFDVTIPTLVKGNSVTSASSLTTGLENENGGDCNALKDIEQRVNRFLDNECVHTVMLQDYLKALGTYTESQKC